MFLTRFRRLLIGCAVLAIGVVVAVVLILGRPTGHEDPPPSVPAADAGPAVASALRKLTTDPQALRASGAPVTGDVTTAIPPGSTVVPDEGSWAPDGLGGGTMVVTVTAPGGAPTTYAAVIVMEGGAWKVLATFPVSA